MSDLRKARLRSLLREAPVPGGEDAERRGLGIVEEAFSQRRPAQRPLLPRLAIALATATVLAALLLSPAGAAVRDWVDDVFTAGVRDAEPALTEIPGGGRMLVQTPAGPWVVQADGSRRLLGDYREATWSPRGLFVAAASGRTLSAVEPGGTPHWSISVQGTVADPRWSPSGFRIAYRSGRQLRVTAADGSGDALLAPSVEPVAPAWSPQGLHQVAYVDGGGTLRIADAESGDRLGESPALPGVFLLEWGALESTLLEASREAIGVRRIQVDKVGARLVPGPRRALPLPPGASVRGAALSPQGTTVAAVLGFGGAAGPRSAVVLIDVRGGSPRRLFSAPGRLAEVAWSPDGSRLMIAWPQADQWLFVPTAGVGRVRAVGNVAAAFAPGDRSPAFPRIAGWCCPATLGDAG